MWWADIELPNDAVDMGSWASSACYPRRTFYPLSNKFSIQNLLDQYNQLSFLFNSLVLQLSKFLIITPYIYRNKYKITFVHLRYILGDNRPS